MRRTLFIILVATLTIMAVGVGIFHYQAGRPWLDAVLSALTTTGLGQYDLGPADSWVKVFVIFLILTGGVSFAAIFGIVTDVILQRRLQEWFGKRRRRMQGHIVLCGLGNVGFRVLEHLRSLGEEVVVIEKQEKIKFVEDARRLGVQVVPGDIRLTSTLENAGIREARCLIAASDEDLANLEAALNARSVNPGIRIVMRLFDQNLANKVKTGFNIESAFSTSALAAPAFAMAALDSSVIGGFYVGGQLMLNLEITVQAGSRLASMGTEDLEALGDVSILAWENPASGQRRFHPSTHLSLSPGDKLVISTLPEFARRVQKLNQV